MRKVLSYHVLLRVGSITSRDMGCEWSFAGKLTRWKRYNGGAKRTGDEMEK